MCAYQPCTRSVTLTDVSSCQQSFPSPGRIASHLHEHMLWHLLQRCRVRLARTCMVITLSICETPLIAVLVSSLEDFCRYEWLPGLQAIVTGISSDTCCSAARCGWLGPAGSAQSQCVASQLECSDASANCSHFEYSHCWQHKSLHQANLSICRAILPAALDTGYTCLPSGQRTRFEDTRLSCQ